MMTWLALRLSTLVNSYSCVAATGYAIAVSDLRNRRLEAPPMTPFVTDPVCGMTFPAEDAYRVDYRGMEYFFCEPACAATFSHQPEVWIATSDRVMWLEAPWPAPRPRRPERGARPGSSNGS